MPKTFLETIIIIIIIIYYYYISKAYVMWPTCFFVYRHTFFSIA